MSLETFRKRCAECQEDLLAVPNFPLNLSLSGMDALPPFKDVCFDCMPFGRKEGETKEGNTRPLFRPPTLEEHPGGIHPRRGSFAANPMLKMRLREFSEELHREQCRLCGRPKTPVLRFKQRGGANFCPRCFESLSASIRAQSKKVNLIVRMTDSPFYPFRGLFRRIGPHISPRPFSNIGSISEAFHTMLRYTNDTRLAPHPVYKEYEKLGNLLKRTFEGLAHGIIGSQHAIVVGHHMYQHQVSACPDIVAYLNQIDPKRTRIYGLDAKARLFQYLLGDCFPYDAALYEYIQVGLANRAFGRTEAYRKDDGQHTWSMPKSEKLGILLSPRVLPPEALQYINAVLSAWVLRRIDPASSFYKDNSIGKLFAVLNKIAVKYEQEGEFYPLGALKQIVKDPATMGLLETLTHSKANVTGAYTLEHAAADIGLALLTNEDEWWTMLEVGEIFVRARILHEGLDPNGSSVKNHSFWWRTICFLWEVALSTVNRKELRNEDFSFPPTPPDPTLDPRLYSFDKEMRGDKYDQTKTQNPSTPETQRPQGPNTEDPTVRLGGGCREDPGVPGSP